MLRRTNTKRPNIYQLWRKLVDPIKEFTDVEPQGKPIQPFGPRFGLTIFPDFVSYTDCQKIRQQYVDIYLRERANDDEWEDSARVSDGRLQLPPLHPSCFAPILTRLEEQQLVFPDYLNNQTVNLYQPGDFIRAHVDNLFLYDETFAIISLGCPALVKFTHIQNGEELSAIIPDRSVYILEGPARYVYFHSVLPVEHQRISIVLRRCFLRTSATCGPVDERMKAILPYKGNSVSTALMQKQVGCTRIALTDEWLDDNPSVGTFDTGEMVKRLKPLRDWSLQSQLEEDRIRYDELKADNALLGLDFDWRFDELKRKFHDIEREITLNQEALDSQQQAQMKKESKTGEEATMDGK